MQTEETFKNIEAWLAEADAHAKLRRYELAAPLYDKALAALKLSRPEGHPDIAFCLQNLGDSLAFSGSLEQSLATFRELHELRLRQPGTNNADLIAAKYKVAKMLEMVGLPDESAAMYDEASALAEQSLFGGHPLFNAIYEGQLLLFQRTAASPERGAAVSKKLAASGATTQDKAFGGSLLDALRISEFAKLTPPPPKVEETPEGEQETAPEFKFELPPNLIRNVVIVACLLGAGAGAFVWNQNNIRLQQVQKEEAAQKTLVNSFSGQIFESADGQDKLNFLADGKVDVTWDGVKQTAQLTVLQPNSEFSATGSNIGHALWFKQIPDAMLCDDNRHLYDKKSTLHVLLDRAQLTAAAAKEYFEKHKEYPQTGKEIEEINPAVKDNPITHQQDEISVVSAGKERDWNAQSTPAGAKSLKDGQLLQNEPPLAPGAVHCYYFEAGDKYLEGVKRMGFFIRLCGPDGKFLPTKGNRSVYVGEMVGTNVPEIAGLYVAREATAEDRKIDTVKVIPAK